MSANILTYSIASEWLRGSVGTESFRLHAWSGGARGRTGSGAEHSLASFSVFRRTDHSKGIHGGPLPPGLYLCHYVAHHPHLGECIALEPTLTAMFQVDPRANVKFYKRDGFYIHGRVPHGSDGCIVPENNGERKRLNLAVKNSSSAVVLKVTDPGMLLPAAIETGTRIA